MCNQSGKEITGYHFTTTTLRNGEKIPPIGEWIAHEGKIVPCESGLHMSEHPLDALTFAPGVTLHRVRLRGDLQSHGDPVDKWVGRERLIEASANVEKLLYSFARWTALQVADKWDAPDIVVEFLRTGDEDIRAEAYDAANSAANSATSAANSAANSATSAARSAYYAAYSAAYSAVDSAYSMVDSAYYAAYSAADSAYSTADSAAYYVNSAARFAQREKLLDMILAAM